MKTFEKGIYAHLGLLAVQFAEMEYKLSLIIRKLIGTDDDLIAAILTKMNNLTQNIEVLKQLSKIRDFQESTIRNLIDKIEQIRADRNALIHGVWNISSHKEAQYAVLDEKRINDERLRDKSGEIVGHRWTFSKARILQLSDIAEKIDMINSIIKVEDELIGILNK